MSVVDQIDLKPEMALIRFRGGFLAALQGLLPALAPILPHMAEDAWHSMAWQVATPSVFQSGWLIPPQEWQAMPEPKQQAFRALKFIR